MPARGYQFHLRVVIEDIAWPNFIFECSTRYLTRSPFAALTREISS